MGAKKDAKKRQEAAMAQKSQSGDNGGKGKGKGGGKPQKQRNEIVPWGWEQAAKDERKKKVSERTAAEQAARAAKEAADPANPVAKAAVKKQPSQKEAETTKPAAKA